MLKNKSESSSFKKRKVLQTLSEIKKVAASGITKTLKIALSNVFKDEREKLKPFLLQIEINVHFNKLQFKTEADKVLYATTYLRDYTAK